MYISSHPTSYCTPHNAPQPIHTMPTLVAINAKKCRFTLQYWSGITKCWDCWSYVYRWCRVRVDTCNSYRIWHRGCFTILRSLSDTARLCFLRCLGLWRLHSWVARISQHMLDSFRLIRNKTHNSNNNPTLHTPSPHQSTAHKQTAYNTVPHCNPHYQCISN